MTPSDYKALGDDLAKKAGVEGGLHRYFLLHRDRLWATASHFDLWNLRGEKVLEIGPFFSYTPFALKKQGNDVVVMEGDDPVVYPLRLLYQNQRIEFTTCDLFETFGSAPLKKHRLPFPDHHFDCISCWETMEHFNFNPVGFIRELFRILKPGGKAFITVPNMAELENRVKLLFGKSIGTQIECYNEYYPYADGRFFGFHWREFVLTELVHLFREQKFEIVSQEHLLVFQNHSPLPIMKRFKRVIGRTSFALFPSTGSICAIVAHKPLAA